MIGNIILSQILVLVCCLIVFAVHDDDAHTFSDLNLTCKICITIGKIAVWPLPVTILFAIWSN